MIHIVKQGDSLYAIAKRFGTTVESIVSINEIPDPDVLVIGQALVLPSNPSPNRPTIETNLYVEWYTEVPAERVLEQVEKVASNLTYMMPFSYEVLRDGSLTEMNWGTLSEIAKEQQVETVIVIANIEDYGFNASLAHTIFTDEAVKTNLFKQAVAEAEKRGTKHIHIDFEYMEATDRENYVNFIKEFKEFAKGYVISVTLPPKTSADQPGRWYEAFDYKAIGEVADFVVIMTYEWGYSGGPPMAVSPIGPVRRVLEYAKTEILPSKIMMGQNLYGYDWTLPYKVGNPNARALSPQQAIQLAKNRNAAIEYDQNAQAPFFHYWQNGIEHEVWFEDARSIQAKFKLLIELQLLGIAYWHSGFDFPQNWYLLHEMFQVKKK